MAVSFPAGALFLMRDRQQFLFAGGYTAAAAAAAVVVAWCALEDVPLLSGRFLGYLGSRSYGIYLWHLPLGAWLRPLDEGWRFTLAVLLALAAAETSYRLVEAPVRSWHRRRTTQPQDGRRRPTDELALAT